MKNKSKINLVKGKEINDSINEEIENKKLNTKFIYFQFKKKIKLFIIFIFIIIIFFLFIYFSYL